MESDVAAVQSMKQAEAVVSSELLAEVADSRLSTIWAPLSWTSSSVGYCYDDGP